MNLWQRTKIAAGVMLKANSNPAPTSRPGYSKSGSLFAGFANSQRDWNKEAGSLMDNSAVSVLLNTIANNFADAPLVVRRHTGDNSYEIVADHAVSRLVKRPNPSWTRTQLFRALITSLYVNGNAYVYKARNSMGEVVELWYLPHTMVTPVFADNGAITGFKYKVGNVETVYSAEDVIHMRIGVDDTQTAMGKSPLRAVLREIATDNEVLNYTYSILKNLGVPGVIMSPKVIKGDAGEDDVVVEVPKGLGEKVKGLWRATVGSDNRGEPLVLNIPWDIHSPGFKPSELMLDKVGQLAEVRIAGAFGVPVVVVQFLSGLQNVNAKASYSESIEQLYGTCLIPLQRLVCEWLDLQLLPELGDPDSEHCYFDRSEISALQPDVSALWTRVEIAWSKGIIKRSEARALLGFEAEAADEIYFTDLTTSAGLGAAPEGEPATVPGETVPAESDAGVVTTVTMTGIQVTSGLTVIEQLRQGQIPLVVAVEFLVSVGIPRDRAQAMADAIEAMPAPEPAPPAPADPANDPTSDEGAKAIRAQIAARWAKQREAVN